MNRFYYEHDDGRVLHIFDSKQGNYHTRDRIATVYDAALADKIVDMLNANPQYHLSES